MSDIISTIKKTNEILNKYNLKAKKSFGQNFIIESKIVEKIALLSNCKDKTVIEIGPGIGALSQQLALLAKEVIAFEIDKNLLPVLKDTLAEYNNVNVINEDFLQVDLESFFKNYDELVVCANLPYYITTPILFKIFERDTAIKTITVMIQKEVADRFNASINTKYYNALSVITQYLYDVKIVMNVPSSVFNPKPKVDSAVIQFNRKDIIEEIDRTKFFEFVKASFKQRRKTLYNNLKEYFNDKEKLDKFFMDIDKNIRAQELTLNEFIQLFKRIYD